MPPLRDGAKAYPLFLWHLHDVVAELLSAGLRGEVLSDGLVDSARINGAVESPQPARGERCRGGGPRCAA